jgi:hypothetical protein
MNIHRGPRAVALNNWNISNVTENLAVVKETGRAPERSSYCQQYQYSSRRFPFTVESLECDIAPAEEIVCEDHLARATDLVQRIHFN